MTTEIPAPAIRAFRAAIASEWDLPYMASVAEYVSEHSTGDERRAEWQALKAADAECEAKNVDVVGRGLAAAAPYLPAGMIAYAAGLAVGHELLAEKIRQLHQPSGIYNECACKPNHDDEIHHARPGAVVSCDDFDTCEPALYFICAHCCVHPNGEGQLEHCANHHDHGPDKQPICQTAALLEVAP